MQGLARDWRGQRVQVGLVPTMGYLHAGHISLVKKARKLVGKDGVVVVSIYVNPIQFAPTEDFSRYPRDLARDRALCRQAGVDVIFYPSDRSMYPGGNAGRHSTYVVEEVLSKGMESAARPTHFRGVTTVVAKLFNIVLPDVAVFGAKDFQQAAIIRRMVRDLSFPIRVIVAPTMRETDGLAMSSRNKYLSGEMRVQALALWKAIQETRGLIRTSHRALCAARLKSRLKQIVERHPGVRVDYIEFFDPVTLQPVRQVTRGVQMALAVNVGPVRLIDNAHL
jgi:pantoate--beta-alanine ligase